MAADYIIEQMEEEYRENVFEENMREAAIHIIKGMSEVEAISHVEQIQYLREDAKIKGEIIEHGDGNFDSYMDDELNFPSIENFNSKQIYAIQQKLLESHR